MVSADLPMKEWLSARFALLVIKDHCRLICVYHIPPSRSFSVSCQFQTSLNMLWSQGWFLSCSESIKSVLIECTPDSPSATFVFSGGGGERDEGIIGNVV